MATKEEELEKLLRSIDFKNLTAEQITGKDGLLKLLTKKIIEKSMSAEMDLGYSKHNPAGQEQRELAKRGKQKDHHYRPGTVPYRGPA